MLTTSHPLDLDDAGACGRARLRTGESFAGALAWAPSWQAPPEPWRPDDVGDRLEDTLAAWRS